LPGQTRALCLRLPFLQVPSLLAVLLCAAPGG